MKTLAELQREQDEYAAGFGGYAGIMEADDKVNANSAEQIKAYRREKGAAYLVKVYGGITEYTGQRIYNFDCNYVIPTDDAETARLCKEGNMKELEKRVDELGGICLVWY